MWIGIILVLALALVVVTWWPKPRSSPKGYAVPPTASA